MNFKNQTLVVDYNQIFIEQGGKQVMHEWETPLMKKSAEFVCQNGGHILEIGFGMGIASNFIQQQDIESHTICEVHPQILPRLKKWAHDKPNVRVLGGDWYNNLMVWKDFIDQSRTYDGILYDAHQDPHHKYVRDMIKALANDKCHVTWWNNASKQRDELRLGIEKIDFEIIEVDPPKNTYFNHKQYLMPKYVHKTESDATN